MKRFTSLLLVLFLSACSTVAPVRKTAAVEQDKLLSNSKVAHVNTWFTISAIINNGGFRQRCEKEGVVFSFDKAGPVLLSDLNECMDGTGGLGLLMHQAFLVQFGAKVKVSGGGAFELQKMLAGGPSSLTVFELANKVDEQYQFKISDNK